MAGPKRIPSTYAQWLREQEQVAEPSFRDVAEALNLVWGELTVEQVREVPVEVREVCQAVHEMVCHAGDDVVPPGPLGDEAPA